MSKRTRILRAEQKEFGKLFDSVCERHNPWEVWAAFVTMASISISNTVDKDHAEAREQEYLRYAKRYNKTEMDCFCAMLAELVKQLEANPYQDFLGDLYLALGMNDHWKGQFFTPYHICEFMAAVTSDKSMKEEIDQKGWISVSDPACGAGALLVAYAGECRKQEVNYQNSVLFIAQDIDPIVAHMCYLQLSLLGCAGYVVIGDSLAKPTISVDDRGLIPDPRQDVWYTPFYFREEWEMRRQWFMVSSLLHEAFSKDRKETASTGREDAPRSDASVKQNEEQTAAAEKREEENDGGQEALAAAWNATEYGQLTFL